jgi:hypothetical protein
MEDAIRRARDKLEDRPFSPPTKPAVPKIVPKMKAGGTVKAPSTAAIKAYSKEYDTQRPAGKNVHEGFAAGGMVGCKQTRGFGKARRGS